MACPAAELPISVVSGCHILTCPPSFVARAAAFEPAVLASGCQSGAGLKSLAIAAALLAEAEGSGFQCSKCFWFAFAKLAAAPAEESAFVRPAIGYEGKSRGLAYLSDVAAPDQSVRYCLEDFVGCCANLRTTVYYLHLKDTDSWSDPLFETSSRIKRPWQL